MRAIYRVHSVRKLAFVTPMFFVCGLDEDCSPALTISLEWSESSSDLDLYVTEPDGTLVRFGNLVGVSMKQHPFDACSVFVALDAVLVFSTLLEKNGWNS